MRGLLHIRVIGALLACAGGLAMVAAAPASALGSYSPYNETASAALARYLRALAEDPKDFQALIGSTRVTVDNLNNAITNIDRDPQRLIFGGETVKQYDGRTRR